MRTVTTMPDTQQLELPIGDLVYPDHAPNASIQARFEEFDRANRWIYFSLVMLTEDWLAKGNTRISIDMLIHVLRWQYSRQTVGDRRFKLNNDFTSRFARKLIAEHPEWGSVFYTRELKTP